MDSSLKGQVTGSAADTYETFFVPALFQQWAPRVSEAAALATGQSVLDVACGTGVLAREAARRVGTSGRVAGVDCNDGMLAVAKRLAGEVEWRSGAAEKLPFADGEFDAVVSQFGLMFFEDRAQALREMWRVLRPGGHLAVAVWGDLESAPGYAAMTRLLARLFGESVADALRAPYTLGDASELASLFKAAGIPDARISTVDGMAQFPSIADWVRTDVKGWTLADLIDDAQYEALQQAAAEELKSFVQPDGSVRFSHPAHIVAAIKA